MYLELTVILAAGLAGLYTALVIYLIADWLVVTVECSNR